MNTLRIPPPTSTAAARRRLHLDAPRVDLVDLFPVAQLGSRDLRDYAVSFDMANRRLGLERPVSTHP